MKSVIFSPSLYQYNALYGTDDVHENVTDLLKMRPAIPHISMLGWLMEGNRTLGDAAVVFSEKEYKQVMIECKYQSYFSLLRWLHIRLLFQVVQGRVEVVLVIKELGLVLL